ncbi:hypothetical protein MRBBS_3419 [Marinobacter sp. BSs20148]|nr:hypothetical protein MRBBS_3419 [Marinobacter sp. BSs20148]
MREQYNREADDTSGMALGSFSFSTYVNHSSGHSITQIDHCSVRPTEASTRAFVPASL